MSHKLFSVVGLLFLLCAGGCGDAWRSVTGAGGSGDGDDAVAKGYAGTLEAYALQNEVAPGETVEIAAQGTPATGAHWSVRLEAFDDGKRRLDFGSGTVELTPRTAPQPDAKYGLVEAGWPVSFQIKVGEDWPAGVYLVRLFAGKAFTHALFVVNDGKPHDFLLQVSLSTYAAYNSWGGLSLYENESKVSLPRGYRVSLDRPFSRNGVGDFYWLERALVLWLTRAGYDVGFTTNMGIDANPGQLSKTNMLILSGHDEYWSAGERAAVDAAVAKGMHLTSLSANTAYWKINYLPSADGRPRRVVECYKTGPLAEASQTRQWRLEGQPEGNLLGAQYGAILDSWVPLVIGDVSDPVFEGTDMRPGEEFFGLMGPEVDAYYAPASATVIATAPLLDFVERRNTAAMTLLRLPSGAQVFNASGNLWGQAVTGQFAHWKLQRLLANVLEVAGAPEIAPYYSPGYEPSGVRRFLKSTVTTLADVPEGPRAMVQWGSRILFTVEKNNDVYELLDGGQYRAVFSPESRLDALTVDGAGNLYGVSRVNGGIYRLDGTTFRRLNPGSPPYGDGPIGTAGFSSPAQISAHGDRLIVIEHRRTESKVREIREGRVTTLTQPSAVALTGLPLENGSTLLGLADNQLWLLEGSKYRKFSGTTSGWNDANKDGAKYLTPYDLRPTRGGYFVVERYGQRIRFVTAAGGAWTVAGNGTGYRDGNGDVARFRLPFSALEVKPDVLYVSDAGNAKIRRVVVQSRP